MVIHDSRRKRQLVMPSLLPDVARVQAMKVLGVTISCSLSTWIILSDRQLSPFIPCDFFEHTAWQTRQSTWFIKQLYRSQANVCSKRLVGFYICCQPQAFRGCSPTRQTFWLVFKRSTGHSRIIRLCWWCIVQQSTGHTTRTTFCTIQCQMKQCLLMHSDADLTIENWSIKPVVIVESSFIVRMLYKEIY